jgi:polar amino acid transport system substrate-binding protein
MKILSLILPVLATLAFFIPELSHAGMSLNIGSDEWPPFHSSGRSENDVKGFTVDIMRAVLKKMRVRIASYRIYPWKRAIIMVSSGELDAVFTTTQTDERMKYCYFPREPLTTFSYLFFIRKSDEGKLIYNTLDDLKGKKIGLVSGFAYSKKFTDFIEEQENYEEVIVAQQNFRKLMTGRIDYVVTPKRVGYSLIRKLGIGDNCVPLKKPLMTGSLYAMFSKKTVTREFVDRFSMALQDFKSTLEYRNIVSRYNWK